MGKAIGISMVLGLAAAGCVADSEVSRRIVVSEPNDLGVTSLEVTRSEQRGNQQFTLRGLDRAGDERGLVRLTTGTISGLSQVSPGENDLGSEIVVQVADAEHRLLSRETSQFVLRSTNIQQPEVAQFVEIESVAAALAREANIIVPSLHAATNEQALSTGICQASTLLTSPVAEYCCHTVYGTSNYTLFVNAGTNMFVDRARNPTGTPCRASNGTSTCSGTACYYGPASFARAVQTSASGKTVRRFGSGTTSTCAPGTGTSEFEAALGTRPAGQGCCVNGAGPCGPGLPTSDCANCGGGGSAGAGAWDY